MIPIYLSIKGLYSYKETQEIDFTALTSSGLFGIFGSVGSGKSSVLEAIMFVLFYESDRLNATRDNRYYNMLNLQSDELSLDFIFNAGPENAEKYRSRFLAKRNKKDFDKVEVKEKSQYQWVDGKWLPLENVKDAGDILGMTYQNFMQTIIIPQGRFREFIDRSPADRTKMLKELFHLDKFDLSQKTNSVLKQNELQLENLSGRLLELGKVNEKEIDVKKQTLKEIEQTLINADLECKARKAEEGKMNLLKKLFEQISSTEKQWQSLEQLKLEYEEKEIRLKTYEKAFIFLKDKIETYRNLETELEIKKRNFSNLESGHKRNQEEVVESVKAFESAKAAYLGKEQIKMKCDDLETIIEIKQIQENMSSLKNTVALKRNELKISKDTFKELKDSLLVEENHINELEGSAPDQHKIQEVYHWHLRLKDIEKELQGIHFVLKRHHDKLNAQEKKKISLPGSFDYSLPYENLFELIENDKHEIEEQKVRTDSQIQNLLVQKKMADLTLELKDNEPCPVCGSLHHPAHAEVHFVDDRLRLKQEDKNNLEIKNRELNFLSDQLKHLYVEYTGLSSLIQGKSQEVKAVEDRILEHKKIFSWEGLSDLSFEEVVQQRKKTNALQEALIKYKEAYKKKRHEIAVYEEKFEKIKLEVIKYENEFCGIEASQKTLLSQLKVLNFQKFESYTIDQLQESLRKGKKQVEDIIKDYEEKGLKFQRHKQDEQNFMGRLTTEKLTIEDLKKKFKTLELHIEDLLKEKGFLDLDQVIQTLSKPLNIEKERKELEDYQKEVHSTQSSLNSLYAEADGLVYEEEKHQSLIAELENIEDLLQKLKKEGALLQNEIEGLEGKLATKQECEKERERLKIREQNLKELKKMFMGNGFVRYVSSVYLQDLCKAANHRFFKLTNNSLSLELSRDEEFIVRDYLNNGKTRLLKTLSGGQTFQAALCLALALAENVKSLNKAEKSFFFLDEGFGSLDKESLRVVFDTLKTLRNENRIVGIISHVEELQQEIDVYLKIVNDKDKGSQVTYSWR